MSKKDTPSIAVVNNLSERCTQLKKDKEIRKESKHFDAVSFHYLKPTMCPPVPYQYVDIADGQLLSMIDQTRTKPLMIGINQAFITALEHCTAWQLYPVSYHAQYPARSIIEDNAPAIQLSALGLFKRILSYHHKSKVQFFFKDNSLRQYLSYERLSNLCHPSVTVDVDLIPKNELAMMPSLFMVYIEEQLKKQSALPSIVIRLIKGKDLLGNTDKLKVERFYHDFLKGLLQIQQSWKNKHEPMIVLQKNTDDDYYVSCESNDIWSHQHDLIHFDKKPNTVIDTLLDAWRKQALLFTL